MTNFANKESQGVDTFSDKGKMFIFLYQKYFKLIISVCIIKKLNHSEKIYSVFFYVFFYLFSLLLFKIISTLYPLKKSQPRAIGGLDRAIGRLERA